MIETIYKFSFQTFQAAHSHRMLSRNSSLSGNGPPIVLEETDYPLAEGFDKTQVRFLIEHCFKAGVANLFGARAK